MNFYRRRPLALAVSLGMLAAAAAVFLPGALKLIPAVLSIIAIPMVTLILRRRDVDEICNMPAAPFMILCAVIICCLLLTSWAYFDLYASLYDESFAGSIHATVIEVKNEFTYSATYVVRMDTLNGERVNAKGLMYTESSIGLIAGDTIRVDVTFEPLEDFYEAYDVTTGEMLANGYVFACETAAYAEITGESDSLEVKLARLRSTLSAKMGLYVDYDTLSFSKALLLGERGDLGKIWRDFVYIGAIHLLAVSGLHLSILTGMLLRFLLKLRVGYRTRHIIAAAFILFYMALIGFPLSVVRAGIMLIIAYLAFFMERRTDGITSLFVAGALILLCDPPAIYDKGFALSFTATLGMQLFSEDSERYLQSVLGYGKRYLRLRKLLSSIIVSIGTVLFVLPLQWIFFGEVSLMSVVSTLVLAPLCELLLWLMPPYLICALLGFHFLCGRIGWLITVLVGFVGMIAGWMADFSPLISLRYPFVPLIILAAGAAIVWMMVKNVNSWMHALIPLGAASLVFLVCVRIWNVCYGDMGTLDYAHTGRDDAFVLTASGRSVVIDVTSGSKIAMHQVCSALEYNYQTSIDTVILTHLHRRHTKSLRALFGERIVRTLIVPEPIDRDEEYYLADILEVAAEYGVEVISYSRLNETVIHFDDVSVELPMYTTIKRSVHPLVGINFGNGEFVFSYGSGGAWEDEYLWSFIGGSDRLLLGQHGPLYKTPPETLPEHTMVIVPDDHPLAPDLTDYYSVSGEIQHFSLEP